MSNHNKIRPVDKNNLDGKYKILFSSPQSKNSKIPLKLRGLQFYNNKKEAEIALSQRIELTEILKEKNRKLMKGNTRAVGNIGGDASNLIQNQPEIQKLKELKIKRAKELINEGKTKSETMKIIIKEFKLNRDPNHGWPSWFADL
ncbi:hypothetical protein N9K71_04275 [Candidatus Pelagibacter bacterium]|jgi:hypothetical protein|nr:hypothetical protein [Candidatus Pelagibacter bacterium]